MAVTYIMLLLLSVFNAVACLVLFCEGTCGPCICAELACALNKFIAVSRLGLV